MEVFLGECNSKLVDEILDKLSTIANGVVGEGFDVLEIVELL